MKTPLAWKNLTHNKVRTAIALAGVGFAVVLIFMQLGFKGAVRKTATQIYDALDFDLMLRSPAYLHLTEARSFPRGRVLQAASLPEIEKARPFYLGLSEWQAPLHFGQDEQQRRRSRLSDSEEADKDSSGQWRGIITMGTEPYDPVFVSDTICAQTPLLSDPRFVLIDTQSKPEYGPINKSKFSQKDIGVETALGPNRVQIIGLFQLGTGMASNGACLTSPEGYVRACPWQTIQEVNFGLLKLRDPSQAEAVKKRLLKIFGIPKRATHPMSMTNADVEILTRAEVNAIEERRWVEELPLGQIFTLGVWVALIVGVAIVYQVLSSDIDNMMSEYATLKAMGCSKQYLTNVVLTQSVLLAVAGYVPSLIVSRFLFYVVSEASGMPMYMTPSIMFFVLILAIGMCVVSGMVALRKLHQADPADLF